MSSYYHMIDVSDKLTSKRTAIARGKIFIGPAVLELIKNGQMIKGDPLRLAEIAAIMGAKQTSNLIPLCHPLGLDKVEFISELIPAESAVQVYCIATTSAKTGVEMEALTGVSAGLLTIYDLSKISEPALKISEIELVVKIGGKSGVWLNPNISGLPEWINSYLPPTPDLTSISCNTITLSDRASQGVYSDRSGPLLQEILTKAGAQVGEHFILPDEPALLLNQLQQLVDSSKPPALIITTGGTGIGERDVVPETLAMLGGREIPGIGELLRLSGSKFTQFSWGSRSVAIVVKHSLVIALPGSCNAVQQGLTCLLPLLPHLVKMAGGGNHD